MKDGRYAAAGVDIDAGNRMVDLIKPLVRRTARPGADAEIGGFGGLFDLKAAGFVDPILVAANDGVGTKVKIAIETGLHGGIGIDLVAMSVNDFRGQVADLRFFLDYFACGKFDPEATASIVAVVADSGLGWDAPAPFDPARSLGEALLTPTRLYVRSCLAATRNTKAVKAFAHITGGGFVENIPRVLPKEAAVDIDLARVPVLPVFKWLATTGGISESEMLRTFNCGVGMVAVLDRNFAEAAIEQFTSHGETVVRLGEVIAGDGGPAVKFRGRLDLSS